MKNRVLPINNSIPPPSVLLPTCRQGWVPKDDPTDDSVYAKTATRAPFETHPRVVAHSARLESADWRASSRRQFQPPSARDEKLRSYVQARSIHWSPYDRVGVVNADP